MNINANLPPSEQYRLAALDWCEKDAAARMLEECKSAVLAQRMKALGDIPAAHAEREVKASTEWSNYIKKTVHAKTDANRAKIEMEFARMEFMRWQSEEASKRAEMRLLNG